MTGNPLTKQPYYIGTDAGGYFGDSFAICVINSDGIVEYINQTRNKSQFSREVKRLQVLYKITSERIWKQIGHDPD